MCLGGGLVKEKKIETMAAGDKRGKALFLDRDGVVNEDLSYIHRPEQVVFCEGVFSVCRKAYDKGYHIVVVTNQSGIARGYFSEEDLERLHTWMGDAFYSRGVPLSGIYYCPHHSDGKVEGYSMECRCRKPEPGMILKAASDLNLDIGSSLMIGDKDSDRIKLEGLRSYIIRSRYTGCDYDLESLSDVLELL